MTTGKKERGYYEVVEITMKNDRDEYNRLVKEKRKEQNKAARASRSRSRSKSKTRGKAKKEKDPTKPKGKKSAWLYYSMDQRPIVKAAHPSYSLPQVMKAMSKKWKKETEKVKRKYEKRAKADADRWETEMKAWRKKNNIKTPTRRSSRSRKDSSSSSSSS